MTAVAEPMTLQGVQSPNVVVDVNTFFPATRKMTYPMKSSTAFAGLGSTDSVTLRQTGIIAGLIVRVTGTLVFGGTITGTTMSYRWPYNLVRALRLSANGQSNLVNCNGLMLKLFEFNGNSDLTDRGVSRSVAAVTQTQGTLSKACEQWGLSGSNLLGPGVTVPATGTYDVDFDIFVPVAADQQSLVGAIFAQTAATNLSLDIDWETQANIVTLGGSATLTTPAMFWSVTGVVYTIPVVGNKAVVPDLSQFHQLAQFRPSNALAQGDNEILLPGVGVGRRLMRVAFMTSTGTAPGTPLAMTSANYGQVGWRYGGNDTPETYPTGQHLRSVNERQGGSDFGRFWGLGIWDWVSQFAVRDIIDEGATSDLRLLVNLVSAPTTPYMEVVQETLFAAPVGA